MREGGKAGPRAGPSRSWCGRVDGTLPVSGIFYRDQSLISEGQGLGFHEERKSCGCVEVVEGGDLGPPSALSWARVRRGDLQG